MTGGKLEGRTILLVEDEFFQAREMKALLERAGARVIGPTGHADEVPALLEAEHPDAALIDINLGLGADYRTAEALKQEGVPFAFLTGYDATAIPTELHAIPRLEKPANERQLIELLTTLV